MYPYLCYMKYPKKYISILSDYGFKVTFGDEVDTLFLRKSLKALIGCEEDIEDVEFLRNEFSGQTQDSRGGSYDVFCRDEKGNYFIVEMQYKHFKNFLLRSKFYAFQRFNTLIRKGKFNYNNLPNIYSIGFVNYRIFPKSELYYHYGTLKNQKCEEMENQSIQIIVELRKFNKKPEEISTDLDKLIYTMKHLDLQDLSTAPHFWSEEWIDTALKKLDEAVMTAEQRADYETMLAKQAAIMQMNSEEKREAEEEKARLLKKAEEEKTKLKEKAEEEKTKLKEKAEEEKTKLKEKAEEEKTKLKEKAEEEKTKLKEKAEEEKTKLKEKAEEEKTKLKEKAEEEKARLLKEAAESKKEAMESRKEAREKIIAMAIEMKKSGFSEERIQQISGLSLEEIAKL